MSKESEIWTPEGQKAAWERTSLRMDALFLYILTKGEIGWDWDEWDINNGPPIRRSEESLDLGRS